MDKKETKLLQKQLEDLVDRKNAQGLAEFLSLKKCPYNMLLDAFRQAICKGFTQGAMLFLDNGIDEKSIDRDTREQIINSFNIELFRRLEEHYYPFISPHGGDNSGPALRYLVMLQTVRAEDHRREMAELKDEITALKKRFEEEIGPKTLDKPKSPESSKKGL